MANIVDLGRVKGEDKTQVPITSYGTWANLMHSMPKSKYALCVSYLKHVGWPSFILIPYYMPIISYPDGRYIEIIPIDHEKPVTSNFYDMNNNLVINSSISDTAMRGTVITGKSETSSSIVSEEIDMALTYVIATV